MTDRATRLRRLSAAPDVAPVTNSPIEVLSVLTGTHLSLGHQVELHPLLRVGSLDFTGHVKRIRAGAQIFTGKGPDTLSTVLNKKLTIQRIQIQGKPHVRIKGTKTGFNHWNLRARVVAAPDAVVDGTRVRLDILKGNQVVPKALGLSAVAVAGTVAQTKIQPLVPGDIIEFQALIRMHLPTILDQISSTAKEIALPVEFVLLDLE